MFSFTNEQKIYDLSGIKIGGQPGRIPTVLFAGLFFKGQPDFENAKEQLDELYLISNKIGNPAIPDFFIKKEEYITDIVNFISSKISKDKVFSVDIIEPSLKIRTLQELSEKGLLSRTIFNSIHIGIKDDEREALKKYTPQSAIIVAFNPKDKSPDGKIEVLENGANLTDVGLIDIAKDIGIKDLLIDTAAMAPGDNSGASIAAIPVIKEEYGLPTGCAIHNVVEKSNWLNDFPNAKKSVDASSNLNIPLFGGDFAIFGPINNKDLVLPIISWQDILISEYTESYFGVEPNESHPRRKLF